jgi:hypothetical protein
MAITKLVLNFYLRLGFIMVLNPISADASERTLGKICGILFLELQNTRVSSAEVPIEVD